MMVKCKKSHTGSTIKMTCFYLIITGWISPIYNIINLVLTFLNELSRYGQWQKGYYFPYNQILFVNKT